jgi:uncharacterized protein DUF4375
MSAENDAPKQSWIVVTDEMIIGEDLNAILAPIDFAADFYHGREVYSKSIAGFIKEQIWLYSVGWYSYEVLNGGHDQFFTNSTGLLTSDALAGLDAMGLLNAAALLEEAIRRFGGTVPDDRDLRCEIIEDKEITFDDLDGRFDDAEVWNGMDAYPKAHASAFRFEGLVTAPPWKTR